MLFLFKRLKRPQNTTSIAPIVFSWEIVIEHDTVLESCAIDALMTVQSIDRDMYTYVTDDIGIWGDFNRYRIARAKAIKREFMDRYG